MVAINDREKQVLGAIIDYYLTFGDTIGSRTLVKKYDIGFSSATIRNVMADLEDMGYISKTHTSSGRVPTDLGYKFYLHELLKIEQLSKTEMAKIDLAYEKKVMEIESVLERTSSLLSKLTSYAGIVIEPDFKRERIKKVELVHIDDYLVMAVIVSENLEVRTKKIPLDHGISKEELEKMSKEINDKLKHGELHTPEQVTELILEKANPLLAEFEREIYQDIEGDYFLDNATSIFHDKSVKEVQSTLEMLNRKKGVKDLFESLVKAKNPDYGRVNVAFGEELNIPGLEEFSFVYSTYKMGSSQGVIGVIGPKRMAYSKTMGFVEYVTQEVNKAIIEIEHKKEK